MWIPNGTEAQVSDLQKQHAAATALVQTLDTIRRIGPEWLSDTKNTDKVQQLKQLMGDARLQAIAAKNLGVPTGHDIELAENFIGTSDPTRWKDSLAGLIQGRDSLVRDHNAMLRTHGLDKKWDPPDLSHPPAAKDATADKQLKMLLDSPENVARQTFAPDGSIRPARSSEWEAFPEQRRRFRGDTPRPDYHAHGVLLMKQELDALARSARDPNAPDHDQAIAQIAKVAGLSKEVPGASTAEVRDYARQLLHGPGGVVAAGIDAIPAAGGQ